MTGEQTILNEYGVPDAAYQAKWCAVWEIKNDFPWFPVEKIYINNDFRSVLFLAFTDLQNAGLHTEIKTHDGCFNPRCVRGSESTSAHAWAAAIDLNADENPMVVNPTQEQRLGKWSQQFVDTMKSAGVYFGGDFIHRSDPMHFSLVDL